MATHAHRRTVAVGEEHWCTVCVGVFAHGIDDGVGAHEERVPVEGVAALGLALQQRFLLVLLVLVRAIHLGLSTPHNMLEAIPQVVYPLQTKQLVRSCTAGGAYCTNQMGKGVNPIFLCT